MLVHSGGPAEVFEKGSNTALHVWPCAGCSLNPPHVKGRCSWTRQNPATLFTPRVKSPPGGLRAHLSIAHAGQQVAQPLPRQLIRVGCWAWLLLLLFLTKCGGCLGRWRDCRWRWLLLGAHSDGPAHSPASPDKKLGWAGEGRATPRETWFTGCQGAGSDPHGAANREDRFRRKT